MLMPRMRTRKHPFAVTALANGLTALAALANGFEMVHDYPHPHPIAPHRWRSRSHLIAGRSRTRYFWGGLSPYTFAMRVLLGIAVDMAQGRWVEIVRCNLARGRRVANIKILPVLLLLDLARWTGDHGWT